MIQFYRIQQFWPHNQCSPYHKVIALGLAQFAPLLHCAPLPPREILIKSGVRREGRSSAHIYEEWQCSCALSRERGLTYVFLLWYKF